MSSLEIVAHRGASQDAPENTLAALALAWQHGEDAAEIDIHECQSGEIVVMHDANTLRTTGFDAEIAALNLEELKTLDAGAWKGPQFRGEAIPTLDEVLAQLPPDKRLFIEIKGMGDTEKTKTMFAPLKTSLKRSGVAGGQIALIGFNGELMKTAKAVFPDLQVGWLRGAGALKQQKEKEVGVLLDEAIQTCHETGIDTLFLGQGWLCEAAHFRRVREAGLKLFVHGSLDESFLDQMPYSEVNGFITDYPAAIRARFTASTASEV